jgi:site-specific DNA recombinase
VGAGVNDSGDSPGKLRAVISARYSDEKQDESSNVDQIRECRDAAEQNGWTVLDEFIRSDSAKTGKTLAGRDGLKELVELAGRKPRPFDVIMFQLD